MSRLTRDGTAETVSRDQILRHVRGQGNIHFPCSADHEQDWHPYPVDPHSAICDDHTYIQVSLIPPWEDQCEWHRMTRMTGPDCAVMCNSINVHTYIPGTYILNPKYNDTVPLCLKIREAKDGNGPGDIWGTTVRNKDEELKTFWDLWFFGNIVWGITRRGGCEAYFVTLANRCSFLCVSGQRGT